MTTDRISAAPVARSDRERHVLFSPQWFEQAYALTAKRPLDEASAIHVGLLVTDAPPGTADALVVLADLDGGTLRFRPGAAATRPTLAFTLTHEQAGTLLFGSQKQRTCLFEQGGMVLAGAFLFVFFLDRLLAQDVTGELTVLRSYTTSLPGIPSTDGWLVPTAPATPPPGETEAVRAAEDVLPETMAALRAEIGTTTPGAQIYVSHAPSGTAVSVALGDSRPGVPFTCDSRPIWYCCSKTVGAAAFGRLWEQGLVDPWEPIAAQLPWFGGTGKESITFFQLLTHTTPVPMALDPLHGSCAAPLEIRREQIRAMAVPPGARAGERINYAPWWAWFVLAETVRAVDGRDYESYVADEILAPCGMTDTRVVLTADEYRASADRLPLIHITGGGLPDQPTYWYATEASCTRPIHGLNMRGPVRDLGRFLEMLLAQGMGPGGRVLEPTTVAALTAHHRIGLTDPFGNADWGLGFRIESRHLGQAYTAFSRHASLRSFGHYGLWTSVAFADPDAGLVTALHLNGKTLQDDHQRRTLAVCDAVYKDLGLA